MGFGGFFLFLGVAVFLLCSVSLYYYLSDSSARPYLLFFLSDCGRMEGEMYWYHLDFFFCSLSCVLDTRFYRARMHTQYINGFFGDLAVLM